MPDISRALFNLGLLFDHTELNLISTQIGDELLQRTKHLVKTPGVMLPTGSLTDTEMKASANGVDEVLVEAGVAFDDVGQFIEITTQQAVTVPTGSWILYVLWSSTDSVAGTFETGYPLSGDTYTTRSRSFTLGLDSTLPAHAIRLATLVADGIAPVAVTDAREIAELHWAAVNWAGPKSALAAATLQQGIPSTRLDYGVNKDYLKAAIHPTDNTKVRVALGVGLDKYGNVIQIDTYRDTIAVPNDGHVYYVKLTPPSTYGDYATVSLVIDSSYSANDFYVASATWSDTAPPALVVTDRRTRLWMRSPFGTADLPVQPTRLRLGWGFMSSLRNRRGVGDPDMGQIQNPNDLVYIKATIGDGGTGTCATNTLTKTANEVGNWTVNEWAGHQLIVGGRYYTITSNTSTILTLSENLLVSGSQAFEIVPGGNAMLWLLQTKRTDVAVGAGEVTTQPKAINAKAEEGATGFVTTDLNEGATAWAAGDVLDEQPKVVDWFGAGSSQTLSRHVYFKNLPPGAVYRVRCQARGGVTDDFWSPWSSWVIIWPRIPTVQRARFVPHPSDIIVHPKAGGVRFEFDFTSRSSDDKDILERYFAGVELTLTEGQSWSGQAGITKGPAPTPVPPSPFSDVPTLVGQIHITNPGPVVQVDTEPLCRVRCVLRYVFRDGTVSDAREVAWENGALVCVTPRTAALNQGTVIPSLDELMSGSMGQGNAGVGLIEHVGYAREILATTPSVQTIRTLDMTYVYGQLTDPTSLPTSDVYYRVRNFVVRTSNTPGSQWYARVTAVGTGVTNRTWLLTPATGPVGHLVINEVLKLQDYQTILLEIWQDPGSTTPGLDVHAAIVTNPEPNYIPPEEVGT